MHAYDPQSFWPSAWALRGAVTRRVLPRVLVFTAVAGVVTAANQRHPGVASAVGPAELVGAVLMLLLVLRSNAGHNRWWEARKLWGGIVNQTRNLAILALAHGPDDAAWRDRVVRGCAAFAHACRRSLRGEREAPELLALLGAEDGASLLRAPHLPSAAALRLDRLLRAGVDGGMDRFAFLAAEQERAKLIDHVGGCERILKTPLPLVYVIKIRRLVALYLLALPFALVGSTGLGTPLVTMLVAYGFLGVDQIAVELGNPFAKENLSHLPLDEITEGIEKNLLGLARREDSA